MSDYASTERIDLARVGKHLFRPVNLGFIKRGYGRVCVTASRLLGEAFREHLKGFEFVAQASRLLLEAKIEA